MCWKTSFMRNNPVAPISANTLPWSGWQVFTMCRVVYRTMVNYSCRV